MVRRYAHARDQKIAQLTDKKRDLCEYDGGFEGRRKKPLRRQTG
jgi:hypothetical protein